MTDERQARVRVDEEAEVEVKSSDNILAPGFKGRIGRARPSQV